MSETAALPAHLKQQPRLSRWLEFAADRTVIVRSGKVEIGQGILTALAQVVAWELDLSPTHVRMQAAATDASPDEAVTSGSQSIQQSGAALRQAAAEARAHLTAAAARRLKVAPARLRVADGQFLRDGQMTGLDYWDICAPGLLEVDADGRAAPRRDGLPASATRIDLPDKVFGRPRYLHDLAFPAMLHGAVLHPPSPGARILAQEAVTAPGLTARVRDGDFTGVIAASERKARAALAALSRVTRWSDGIALPDAQALPDWLREQPVETTIVDERVAAAPGAVATRLSARYSKPYFAHASIAPSCAIARWRDDGRGLEVWSHSQGIFNLRTDLCLAFGLETAAVVVRHVEGAGCYGHNGADDCAYEAALLARQVPGRHLRLQFTRADEFTAAPLGPAMAIDLAAALDAQGEVVEWRHAVWSNGHGTRPGRAASPAFSSAWRLSQPFAAQVAVNPALTAGGGAQRNAVPGYAFPAWTITNHRLLTMPLRTSALRSLGGLANVFAIESFIDELAHAAGQDPLAWRLRHLADERARAVLERAARMAGWPRAARAEGEGFGMGVARYKGTATYCAVVARVLATHEVRATHLWIAVDCGRAINPDGIANQIEGGAIQAASMVLKEAVAFDRASVTSVDWENYPILRFSEVPAVEVAILADPAHSSTGAGEASMGPTAGALGNAVFDALGLRVRDLPITPARIRALAAA